MLTTTPAAVVEPKQKSQDPAAKSKRLKRLRTNPDYAEAVSGEREVAVMWEMAFESSHRKYMAMGEQYLAIVSEKLETLQTKKDYIEQLLENKKLNKLIETQSSTVKMQFEVIEGLQRTNDDLMEILEVHKRARNPNRLTGGKRGRPIGSKSKSVTFGAEAMPDNDLVPIGTTAEFEAALL